MPWKMLWKVLPQLVPWYVVKKDNNVHPPLHSGSIGGGHPATVVSQGILVLKIQCAGRWKSRAFMTFVKEAR